MRDLIKNKSSYVKIQSFLIEIQKIVYEWYEKAKKNNAIQLTTVPRATDSCFFWKLMVHMVFWMTHTLKTWPHLTTSNAVSRYWDDMKTQIIMCIAVVAERINEKNFSNASNTKLQFRNIFDRNAVKLVLTSELK